MGLRNERGPRERTGGWRAEQFHHRGNYTLTPASLYTVVKEGRNSLECDANMIQYHMQVVNIHSKADEQPAYRVV